MYYFYPYYLAVLAHGMFAFRLTTFFEIAVNRAILVNRPFPSFLVSLLPNESKCETFPMKMSSACSFIFMQIKVIFIRMVSHLDSEVQGNSEMAYLQWRPLK